LPGFGKLVKQKRKAHTGFNPKMGQSLISVDWDPFWP
jgi:nucleoid DNA-binding protein